jgi:hypothetical protein
MDIDALYELVQSADDSSRKKDVVMARACIEAYEQGFEEGEEEAHRNHYQTQILLMHTAGSA